jgi:SAM-dependent methyltransferase
MAGSQHLRFARAYAQWSQRADAHGMAALRARLTAGASGRVIEVGAGNGRNFSHYPSEVIAVLAVEPDRTMREYARSAAAAARVPIAVEAGDAGSLPAGDASMDVAVVSLVMCTVPDPPQALAEVMRVLRPGGELRFFEHVRSRRYGWLEDVITPLWAATSAGCHPNRDTARRISEAGFTMESIEEFGYSPSKLVPRTAHILGVARKPS